MKSIVIVAAALLASLGSAEATETTGSGALALAALVGAHAQDITAKNKHALASMLDGHLTFASSAAIKVAAASVSCRSSNVDISAHDCTIKFGKATCTLNGRAAHEVYATLIENGIPGDGAAGSNFEAISHLACTITPAEVKQKAGGGATCSFSPGP